MNHAPAFVGLLLIALLVGCSADEPDAPTASSQDRPTATEPSAEPTTEPGVGSPQGPTPVQFRPVIASGDSQASATVVGDLRDEFDVLDCGSEPSLVEVSPEEPQVSCDSQQVRYALESAALTTVVASAGVTTDESGNPLITLTLDAGAAAELERLTTELAEDRTKLAVVVDGSVITALRVISPIEAGDLQITSDFSEPEADEFVRRLTAAG